MAGEGTYKCTLSEATLKKAKEELNEDPQQRASQIEAFRKWVKEQPHINSRTDDDFLLRFLRNAKFSQLKAQEKLDNFWTVRSVPEKGIPEWFGKLDPMDPAMQKLMDTGLQTVLPGRDDHGRKVILVRTGHYDPKEVPMSDVMKIGFLTSEVLMIDETTQVNGVIVVLDFAEFGSQHVFNWDRETIRKASRCWQDVYPTRNKGINYLNTPTVFNALWEIFKFFMKEKTMRRTHFHKFSLESLHEQVPKRMLPTEYGGEAGSMDDLARKWKEYIVSQREEILRNARYGIDESKRPIKVNENKEGFGMHVVGSFRKLAID